MTRIGCVIPTHNMAGTLSQALSSACHQTFDEIVVMDDASTDDTPAVVEQYASRFTSVKYVRHDQKTACHLTALRPICDSLGCDHIVTLAADDMLLPGLVTAIRGQTQHAVVFSNYSCEHGNYTWYVRHPFEAETALAPDAMRVRVQTQQAVETGVGSSLRSDVLQWLWDLRWTEMGPHADSIGYATAACVFGAAYVPICGAHIRVNVNGYGHSRARENPQRWATTAEAFMRRAGLDDATIAALIAKRCYGFSP